MLDIVKGLKVLVSFGLASQYIQKIKDTGLALEVRQSKDKRELLSMIEDVEVLFAGRFTREMFFSAEKLMWMHSFEAGIDHLLFPEFVESQVILTSSSGVQSGAVSEHVLSLILSFTRGLNLLMRNAIKKRWKKVPVSELDGKTIGLVGFGNVGRAVARKARCLGMNVVVAKKRRSVKPDYVDELFEYERLRDLLAKSDFVVLAVPLTSETSGMVGETELRGMKKTAYLINVSRGKVVREHSLIRALKEGWIAGAGLDVFEEEPLSSRSKLWKMENVIITPHIAGTTPYYKERSTDLFCENLKRFVHNEPLKNMIDKRIGY